MMISDIWFPAVEKRMNPKPAMAECRSLTFAEL